MMAETIDITGTRNAQLAIDQLNKELEKHTGDENITRIHEFLIDMVTANPELAEAILSKNGVLKKEYNMLREAARKKQVNGAGGMSDKAGFEMILKDLGIKGYEIVLTPEVRKVGQPEPAAKQKSVYIDLEDLL